MLNWSPVRRALRTPGVEDALIAAAVAILAYAVAQRSLANFSAVPWIEDLLVPCTGRPGWVPDPVVLKTLPQWHAFISRQTEYFPCEAITGMPLVKIGTSWRQSEYFHRLLGLWFQVIGPSIRGFVTFQAAFHGATCAVAYLVFRLGLSRIVSLAVAAGLVWSTAQLAAVAMPIEYAKAPWLLAVVGLCGLLLRRDTDGRSVWQTAFALGVVTGLGIGFKTDLIAAVPLALMAAILVRGTAARPGRRFLSLAVTLLGISLGSGWLVYQSLGQTGGSALAVQFLGGMDSQMEATYSANPLYDYGLAFDDSHITVLLNTYAERALGTVTPVYFYSMEMQRASVSLLRELWLMFPGDLVLRVIAVTLRVIQLNGYGLPLAVGGMFVVLIRDPRAGSLTALAVIYLAAYVSLVFQRRHFYHLEFISWGLAGAVIQALCTPRRWLHGGQGEVDRGRSVPRRLLLAVLVLALIVATGFATLMAARYYQQRSVLGLLEGITRAPREGRKLSVTAAEAGETLVRVGGISVSNDEPAWRTDQMRGSYVAVTVACVDDQPVPVTAQYRPPGQAWNRSVRVVCRGAGTTSTLMLPIYEYGPTYRFDGLMLNRQAESALQSVAVVNPAQGAPIWLLLQLPADWREQSWFKTMQVPLVTP